MGAGELPAEVVGDGLVLRAWRPERVALLAAAIAANVDHLRPWMPWIAHEPLSTAARLALIEGWERSRLAGSDVLYGIFVDDVRGGAGVSGGLGVVAGGCGLHRRIGPGGLEIGYWVAHDHLGRGLATKASALLTDLGFTVPDIDRVEIHHSLANERSALVPARLGYRRLPDAPIERERAPAEVGLDGVWQVTRAQWAARRPTPD